MPRFQRLRAVCRETDRAAVTVGSRLPVDGPGDREHAGRSHIEASSLFIYDTRLAAQFTQQGIVELLRRLHVVAPEHDMAEHLI